MNKLIGILALLISGCAHNPGFARMDLSGLNQYAAQQNQPRATRMQLRVDNQCMKDCREAGYNIQYCQSRCSYQGE